MIGNSLTHYRITAKLGAGGMGEVYRASDTKLGREVAIKVLPASISRDATSLARFEREAKALASLNHPHIAAIHGFDADQGTHFLVLELVEGQTLSERLRRGRLPVEEALRVARQIAEAVEAAHAKGIIHRDLKPGNIKLTPEGRVKVLDFGLAKMEESVRSPGTSASDPEAPTLLAETTQPGAVMGTPAYMSPEQARGQEVDKRTDVWAFGCCLFECLAGRKPFRGETVTDLMAEVLKSEPDWSALPAEVPREVATLLRRCLEKDPRRRLRDLGDIALVLEETAQTRTAAPSLAAKQPTSVVEAKSFSARFGLALGVTGLLIGLLIAGIATWRQPKSAARASQIRSLAVLPFINLSRDADQEYFVDGVTELLCTELAGLSALMKVPSRTTIMQFKRTARKIPEIAAELEVDAIVGGSVQFEGDLVVMSVQLIEGSTDRHLWGTNYERQVSSLLRLKTELARSIAAEINVQLTPQEQSRLAKVRPRNPEALTNYFRGRELLNRQTLADLTNSVSCFQRALHVEPNFSDAFAGIANAYASLSSSFVAPREAMPPARTNALAALRLDETCAEAHFVLGVILLNFDYDFVGADREFARALAINPNYADAYDGRALLRQCEGRMTEAVEADETAFRLDPLSMRIGANYVSCLMMAGEFDRSIRVGNEVRKLHQEKLKLDNHMVAAWLGFSHSLSGDPKAAISLLEPICRPTEQERLPMAMAGLGHAFALAGQKDSAHRTLAGLEQVANERYVCVYEIAVVYAALGERDRAFEWLYKALAARADCIPFTKVDPRLKPLHPDPRFKQLLKDIGLER